MVRTVQNIEEEADEDGNTLFTASYCLNRPRHVHGAVFTHSHTHTHSPPFYWIFARYLRIKYNSLLFIFWAVECCVQCRSYIERFRCWRTIVVYVYGVDRHKKQNKRTTNKSKCQKRIRAQNQFNAMVPMYHVDELLFGF